jgi:Gdp/GTP exchange factor required for growth at low temperatures
MHLLGEKFAAATRKSAIEDEDSDVDLDFLPDQATLTNSSPAFQHDAVNAHLSTAHVGAGLSPTRPATIPFSSFSILQRIDHTPGPIQDPDVPFVQNAAMPIQHSAISRAFVKTIGKLGRWKRVLNSRAVARTSLAACADVSAFDLELGVSRDLLTVNGGVENYLSMAGHKAASQQSSPFSTVVTDQSEVERPAVPFSSSLPTPEDPPKLFSDEHVVVQRSNLGNTIWENLDDVKPEATEHVPEPAGSAASFRSSSTDSFGSPLASGNIPLFPSPAQGAWQFDVVSIDDLDFSDTSSDFHVVSRRMSPPGLRRLPRKLPLRRDFEFVRRDTVSSMGIATRDSVASNASSVLSSPSPTGLGGNIAQWQLNSLIDSLSADEEAGDVEDALRRLEGQLNPEKQQEKASKVDGWVRTMRERMVAGNYVDEPPRFFDEDEFDDDENTQNHSFDSFDNQDSASQHEEAAVSSISESSQPSDGDGKVALASTPIPTQTAHFISTTTSSTSGSPTRPDAKPAPEPAVPLEILESRVTSRPSTASSQKAHISRIVHRSWILGIRTAVLANHFAMVDRELFMGVKFEELVLDDWIRCEEVNVLDWSEFLDGRERWRAESRFAEKTTALAAVRGRFNLMANFIISEIVLTPPNERPALVAKFIRIAWVSPRFHFLVLIFRLIFTTEIIPHVQLC